MAQRSSRLRVTVWELFALSLVPGVGIAAIKAGGLFVYGMLTAGGLWFIFMAIVAAYGTNAFRSFAGGFVIASGIYFGLVLYFGAGELNANSGVLPTSQALRPLRDAITTYTYFDAFTAKPLTPAETAALRAAPGSRLVSSQSDPESHELMSVGHLLIGLLLGYLGGKTATLVSHRPFAPDDADESASR